MKKKTALPILYKQEGEFVPFTLWWPFIVVNDLPKRFFSENYRRLWIYCRKDYGYVYLNRQQMDRFAASVYAKHQNKTQWKHLWRAYQKAARALEDIYATYDRSTLAGMRDRAFTSFLKKIAARYRAFWRLSIFIDAFDSGFDAAEIRRIADMHALSSQDAAILTTHCELTFNNERLVALFGIIRRLVKRKDFIMSKVSVEKFVSSSRAIARYKKAFDWHASNYGVAHHITDDDIAREVMRYVKNSKALETEYNRLRLFARNARVSQNSLCRRYGMCENPLWFFNRLTYWREHRKKFNLMGIQVLFMFLEELAKRTGIAARDLTYLFPPEFDACLQGRISQKILMHRREQGVLLEIEGRTYHTCAGAKARAFIKRLEDVLQQSLGSAETTSIPGHVASMGYAKGVARVILHQREFAFFRDGEILITTMTRPEFLPIMKKAKAIVTNEGGITSHAAIVSRELGKPCVIGTQVATHVIRTGDIVEVRAHHGTVRILKKA